MRLGSYLPVLSNILCILTCYEKAQFPQDAAQQQVLPSANAVLPSGLFWSVLRAWWV